MSVANRAIACSFLLLAPCVYGQDAQLPASDFTSKDVGLTETLVCLISISSQHTHGSASWQYGDVGQFAIEIYLPVPATNKD